MEIAKLVSLTNVGLWIWAAWRMVKLKDPNPFAKLLLISIGVNFFKRGYKEPRPPGANACDAFGLGGKARSFGMPSGHVAGAVAGWVMVARSEGASRTLQLLTALIAALLMGWSRVKLGCHTPMQALAGALFGLAALIAH